MTDNTPAESADMLEALAAENAALQAALTSYMDAANEYMRGEEAAEAELSRLRTAQDAMVGAVIEQAAHFCHYHAVGLDPRRGYVVDEWTEEMGGKHPGMAYAPAIRALRPDATSALERMLREARNDERERCASIADRYSPDIASNIRGDYLAEEQPE